MPSLNKPQKANAYSRAVWSELKGERDTFTIQGTTALITDIQLAEALSMDYGVAKVYSNSSNVYLMYAHDNSSSEPYMGLITPSPINGVNLVEAQCPLSGALQTPLAIYMPPIVSENPTRFIGRSSMIFASAAADNYSRIHGRN